MTGGPGNGEIAMNHTANLPEGWTLKGDFLIAPDGYKRWIKQDGGRIDRCLIACILENHGYDDMAKRWYLSPAEIAAPDLLEACKMVMMGYELARKTMPVNMRVAVEQFVKPAIAKAE